MGASVILKLPGGGEGSFTRATHPTLWSRPIHCHRYCTGILLGIYRLQPYKIRRCTDTYSGGQMVVYPTLDMRHFKLGFVLIWVLFQTLVLAALVASGSFK